MKGRLFDIQRGSFVDGPGIRTAVFFKGCNLNCGWCHNPESKSREVQMLFYKERCKGCGICREVCPKKTDGCVFCGKCAEYCPNEAKRICGKDYTLEEVLEQIKKDLAFYKSSNGGVTFTGGECMLQIDFLQALASECKKLKIHTAVDTAGNVGFDKFEKILDCTDLFLYDVKCVTEQLHVQGTGVSNKLILENLKRLSQAFGGDIVVRVPVVGGFNDDIEEIKKIAEYVKPLNVKGVELLPYHSMGKGKSLALGMEIKNYTVPKDLSLYEKLF